MTHVTSKSATVCGRLSRIQCMRYTQMRLAERTQVYRRKGLSTRLRSGLRGVANLR